MLSVTHFMPVVWEEGAVLRWGQGGTAPPPQKKKKFGQAPQIFWFQQQKYAFLKSRLFFVQWRNQHLYQLVHKQ